jgi:hypothetical protein
MLVSVRIIAETPRRLHGLPEVMGLKVPGTYPLVGAKQEKFMAGYSVKAEEVPGTWLLT